MRLTRISKAVAVGAAAAMALSACAASTGTNNSSSAGSEAASGGEIRVVETNIFSSLNPDTPNGNTDINSKIAYTTQWDFNYITNDLKVQKNEQFGNYEVVSEDPFTVKYTINEGVTWSDGEAIDADDMLFAWAVFSGHFDDAKLDENGEVESGTSYFNYAGDTTGLGLTKTPVVGDDNRSVTLEYTKPFADWEIAFGITTPAHIAAKKADITTEELSKLILETPKGDPEKPAKANATVKKVADFYNTGYETKTLPSDPDLLVASGPFMVKDMVADQSMTLVRNEKFNWGPQPKVDSIVVKYIGEAPAQIAALKNGEADIIAPQPSSDTLEQIEAIGDTVAVNVDEQLSYDHLDLSFNSEVFKDKAVREAFLKTIPRKQIVDSVVGDLDNEAVPLDSQMFVPANEGYAGSVEANGSSEYAEPDIAGAKELLDGKTPTVRILYNSGNPNRVDTYALIEESATQAGFKIEDGGDAAWGDKLGDGTYDASIFGWISPGVGVSGVPQIFKTGGGGNYSAYSNKSVDALADEIISTPDPARQTEIQQEIDKHLFEDAYGLPLFQAKNLDAYSTSVEGLKSMPNQTGVWWNFWEWSLKQ
jgi:peptide/nickel transport system substrate-binding protein